MIQETSRDAYYSVLADLPSREQEVFDILDMYGPQCNQEIADNLARQINTVTPNTFRLRERGLVTESHRAIYAPTGRTVIFWKVVTE